ncbi:redox-regulated ATPase YchF [Candidatus Formimonas warabiya]|uniref:Ribosome-binding ATPase YchF n=1 Tax=Formimonas warabiya TaxID=1761012 RepID=A0A3G1KV07_FORW1|nr:redox-regulated ATPase YchF [Candidatus Formimonas warabiya]ATW26240.1 redox-regulated ATPase YchF [Candidatus Formimonas warabiya]
MALSCGIVGLPMVGKTTFFNLLTNAGIETSTFYSGKTTTNINMATVPDERVEFLSRMFHPKKTTFAQIEVIDVPGLVRGSSEGKGTGNEFLAAVRDSDALVHIVRAFENKDVLHVDNSLDLMRDLETVNMELLFADLQLIETRLERINSGKKKKLENPLEETVLLKIRDVLENEQPVSTIKFSDEEREAIKHITFLTDKPMLIVVNLDEKQFTSGSYDQKEEIHTFGTEHNMIVLEICAQVEAEISQLEPEDKQLFMEDLGVKEPGIDRLAKAIYDLLGLISFLTAGEDEVRAWTIKKGLSAKKAAGKIHSDIERGFIRAEIVAFQDLKEAGSMAKAREHGSFRLEGKEYIVQDGDIINFRFNV